MTIPFVARVPGLLPRRNVRAPEPNQVAALVRITARLGTRPATHPLFKLPDWCLSRAPQRREVGRAVRIAAGTFHLEKPEASIQGVTNRRGGLCGAAVAFYAIIPGIAGRNIRREPRLPGALFRMPDRLAPLALFGWSAHGVKDARVRAASATSHRLRVPATIAPNDKSGGRRDPGSASPAVGTIAGGPVSEPYDVRLDALWHHTSVKASLPREYRVRLIDDASRLLIEGNE